jgi:hypothetical protein
VDSTNFADDEEIRRKMREIKTCNKLPQCQKKASFPALDFGISKEKKGRLFMRFLIDTRNNRESIPPVQVLPLPKHMNSFVVYSTEKISFNPLDTLLGTWAATLESIPGREIKQTWEREREFVRLVACTEYCANSVRYHHVRYYI